MVPSYAPVFLLYIDDIPSCLEKAASRMYADDTDIIFDVSDLSVLEREIIAIEENYLWLIAKNSSLDTAKTELMLIGCSYIGQINWEKPRRRNFWKDIQLNVYTKKYQLLKSS